jgi:hypothetical protein
MAAEYGLRDLADATAKAKMWGESGDGLRNYHVRRLAALQAAFAITEPVKDDLHTLMGTGLTGDEAMDRLEIAHSLPRLIDITL